FVGNLRVEFCEGKEGFVTVSGLHHDAELECVAAKSFALRDASTTEELGERDPFVTGGASVVVFGGYFNCGKGLELREAEFKWCFHLASNQQGDIGGASRGKCEQRDDSKQESSSSAHAVY